MTKYYFISFIHKKDDIISNNHCLFKAVDITLTGITKKIQEHCNSSNVIIINLKDLSKEEYEMLNENNSNN